MHQNNLARFVVPLHDQCLYLFHDKILCCFDGAINGSKLFPKLFRPFELFGSGRPINKACFCIIELLHANRFIYTEVVVVVVVALDVSEDQFIPRLLSKQSPIYVQLLGLVVLDEAGAKEK